jgi:hypothetical protein
MIIQSWRQRQMTRRFEAHAIRLFRCTVSLCNTKSFGVQTSALTAYRIQVQPGGREGTTSLGLSDGGGRVRRDHFWKPSRYLSRITNQHECHGRRDVVMAGGVMMTVTTHHH